MARRRRRWLGIGAAVFVALFFAAYTVVYFKWNDEALARSVSAMVSGSLRGDGPTHQALVLKRAHYPYWGSLRSLFFGGPAWVDVWDATVWDPDGKAALHIEHAHAQFYLGQLVWAQARSTIGRPDIELHVGECEIDAGSANIGIDSAGRVNLPDAMSGKVDHPSDGGIRVRVEHAVIRDGSYAMTMPGWHGAVAHIAATATLSASTFPDEQTRGRINFQALVTPLRAASGELTLGAGPGAFVFPFGALEISRFEVGGERDNDLFFTGTTTTRGAPVTVDGRLLAFTSPATAADLTIGFRDGAELVKMLPTGDLLSGDPSGEVRIHGPLSHILVDGRAAKAEVHLVGITGHDAEGAFHLDGNLLRLDQLRVAAASGTLGGSLSVDFLGLSWQGDLTCQRVDPAGLAPLVPEPARPILAGRLGGRFHVDGNLPGNPLGHPERIRVRDVDLVLARRAADRLPREVTVQGGLRLSPTRIQLDGLGLSGDGVTAVAHGEIDPVRLSTTSDLTVDAAHLAPLLRRLGLGFAVDGLHASAHVTGPLMRPTADGGFAARTVGGGARILPRVDARFHLADGTFTASSVRGLGPLGGQLTGEIAIGLFDGRFDHLRADPRIHVRVGATGLSLEALADVPWLSGTGSGDFELDGTLAHPTGKIRISVPSLTLYGDPYRAGLLSVAIDGDRYTLEKLYLERQHGGKVWGTGSVVGNGEALDVNVRSEAFPLAAIPQLRDVPVALAGTLSGTVHIGGDLDHWAPEGAISAAAVKVRDILLGDGKLSLVPGGDAIHLSGDFFHRFRVDGYLTLRPHIAVNVTVAFDDFPLEELIPELKKLAEVHGIVSGQATFSFDILQGITLAELRLNKVMLTVSGDDEDDEDHSSERRVASFSNEGPVVIATDGKKLTFRQAVMRSALGQFEVRGDLSPVASNLLVRGQIDLHLLEYFFSSVFSHTHGNAFADLRILGAAAKPQVLGTLDLQNAELRPRGAERSFLVPEGKVVFEPTGVKLHQLKAQLDGAEAVAEASLGLVDWVPGEISADVSGELSPTLLAWIFPDHVGETDGRLEVSAHVAGHWPKPTWSGQIKAKNLFFHEKRVGRDVRITEGTIILDNYDLKLGCPAEHPPVGCKSIHARIDDTGDVKMDGAISLPGFQLGRVAIRLAGDNLDWTSPGVYSLTVAPRVTLSGNGEHLRLAGSITLIAGRYQQNFEYRDLVIRPRTVEVETPFYEGTPLLEQLELDLVTSSSGALAIKDNLADLTVSVGKLFITGTLSQPVFDGSIAVEEGGVFKIPFLRAEFTSDKGSISFDRDKEFPQETPRLAIRAWADWIDRYEQQHHILLTVSGTYREPFVDLSSTDGWNRNQVLAALVTGGAPDDLRRSFQNDPTSKASGSGFDGVAKSVSGDFIGNIIEDPIKNTFRLDVARIELGSDSVQIKLCPWRTRYLKLCGTADVGFVSTTRYNANGEFKLSDSWSAAGLVERIEHGIDTSEDVLNRYRLQLMFRHPMH